jgi:hypothetical protein
MQSQLTCRNNDHCMHAHYTAWQTLQGLGRMFWAPEPTLDYHIQWPKTLWRQFYAYCNYCRTNQPAGAMTMFYMLTILLSKYCRSHTETSAKPYSMGSTASAETSAGPHSMATTTYARTSADSYLMGYKNVKDSWVMLLST